MPVLHRMLCWTVTGVCVLVAMPRRAVVAQVAPRPAGAVMDTLDPSYVPAGFGSLRQDDVALKVTPKSGLLVKAIPLDERIIRLLSPDSYRALREQVASKQVAVDRVKERHRLPSYALWYVIFFALEQGETRFSPQEFLITNSGRDYRPLDILPLGAGFGEYRLQQRESQAALFVFDGQIDMNQPTSASMEGVASATDWSRTLQLIERERALIRSRAAASPRKPGA